MKFLGWRGLMGLLVAAAWLLGCTIPPSAAQPALSAAAARQTLDSWNPSYCKVVEFYGLHKLEAAGTTQVGYATIANPSDRGQKPAVYAANFQLLSRPDGRQQWFLTGLITHGSGFLTKRQGWDALMIPVKAVSGESEQ